MFSIRRIRLSEEWEKTEEACDYTKDGCLNDGRTTEYDLFFAPEKKEGWINVYENNLLDGIIYPSKEEALNMRDGDMKYITTIKIELEE